MVDGGKGQRDMGGETPLCKHFGLEIRAESGQELDDLNRDDLVAQFKRAGVLLLRGFPMDLRRFQGFVEQFSSDLVFHQNPRRRRISDDGSVLLVDPNQSPIPAHCELSYSPLRPDLQWFWCVRPAVQDGETTLFDGIAVLEELPEETAAAFCGNGLRYRVDQPIPAQAYTRMAGTESESEAREALAAKPGFHGRYDARGGMTYEYTTPAIVTTPHDGREAFANSFLADWPPVFFEDGSPIPASYRWDLLDISEELAFPVSWRAGDLLMIDNWRIMHGRRAFKDPRREIAAMLSNANF